jgi:thiazole synthase
VSQTGSATGGGTGRTRVLLNGRPAELPRGMSLLAYLQGRGVDPQTVVVAVNGAIVPRQEWDALIPKDDDRIEVVHVVAGGAEPLPARAAAAAGPAAEVRDPLVIAGVVFRSRLICGTGKFPSAEVMNAALEASGCEMVTVAVRYFDLDLGGQSLLRRLDTRRYRLLPNTAGAYSVADAVHLAELARAATGTNWIKLEVIGDRESLWPDVAATVEATRELVRRGFVVLPYTSPDPVAAVHLERAGAATVMPLGSPIGSGQGVLDVASIRRIVRRVSVPVVVDAGIGSPADAAMAMEAGAAAVLVNTAIAQARDPVAMAEAMALAVRAGRLGWLAGRIPRREEASPSTTPEGVPRVE